MLQSFCTSISPAGYLTHTLLILTTPELGQGQGLKQGYPPPFILSLVIWTVPTSPLDHITGV